jgi:plasmid stability protein
MPQLHVRNVADEVVARLKQQAARHGRSMGAEHRLILEHALFPERHPHGGLLEVLQAGPFAEPENESATAGASRERPSPRRAYVTALGWYRSQDERWPDLRSQRPLLW